MNWKNISKQIINDDVLIENNEEDISGYKLITRDNLEDLHIGMHIRYVKKIYNIDTGNIEEKTYNGGFLVNIINGSKVVDMVLILKSNIFWKLRFLKYKIYGKNKLEQNKEKNKLYDLFKEDVDKRVKEMKDDLYLKLNNNKKNKHKVIFGDEI